MKFVQGVINSLINNAMYFVEMFKGGIPGVLVDSCPEVGRAGKVDRPNCNVGSFPGEVESLSYCHLSPSRQTPTSSCPV
jgi:hypothetical protein